MDVVVANNDHNTSTVSVFKNTSAGNTISFAAPQNIAAGTQPSALVISDLDGDGRADIAVANIELPGSVTILRNASSAGSLSFATSQSVSVLGTFNDVKAVDLDGDKKKDLLFTNYLSNTLAILKTTAPTTRFLLLHRLHLQQEYILLLFQQEIWMAIVSPIW